MLTVFLNRRFLMSIKIDKIFYVLSIHHTICPIQFFPPVCERMNTRKNIRFQISLSANEQNLARILLILSCSVLHEIKSLYLVSQGHRTIDDSAGKDILPPPKKKIIDLRPPLVLFGIEKCLANGMYSIFFQGL